MEIILKRIAKQRTYTIGRLYILEDNELERKVIQCNVPNSKRKFERVIPPEKLDQKHYFCDTLEPIWRPPGARKEKGKTAIPEGTYPLLITMSTRFKKWLPLLQGVPGFEGIRIHAGNYPEDTQGCILPGENKFKGMVVNSRIWLHRLTKAIMAARDRDESIWITVI